VCEFQHQQLYPCAFELHPRFCGVAPPFPPAYDPSSERGMHYPRANAQTVTIAVVLRRKLTVAVVNISLARRWLPQNRTLALGCDALEQTGLDFSQEPRRPRVLPVTIKFARTRVSQVKHPARSRHPDITEAPFFLDFIGTVLRPAVRKQTLFHPRDEDHRILESLGGVQCHQDRAPTLALDLVGITDQIPPF